MNIINNEKVLSNNQIKRILKLTKFNIKDNVTIVMLNKRREIFLVKRLVAIFLWIFYSNSEGLYVPILNIIFVNMYNLEGSESDKRLYGIGVLLHELMHYNGENNEDKCDRYSKQFLNNNSQVVKDILKLKDEWKIEDF